MYSICAYYVIKLFSIKNNKFTYFYENNPYCDIYIANRFSSYEEGYGKMQKFFQWNELRRDFDMNKCKVCKITIIEEDM